MFATTKTLRIQFSFQFFFLLSTTIQCIWYRKSIIYMFGSRLRNLLPQLIPCYSLIFHILTTYAATLIDVYSTTHEKWFRFLFCVYITPFFCWLRSTKVILLTFFLSSLSKETYKKKRFLWMVFHLVDEIRYYELIFDEFKLFSFFLWCQNVK